MSKRVIIVPGKCRCCQVAGPPRKRMVINPPKNNPLDPEVLAKQKRLRDAMAKIGMFSSGASDKK